MAQIDDPDDWLPRDLRDLYDSEIVGAEGVDDVLLPCSPTTARPGTALKVEVLAQRALEGRRLWHRKDAKL